MDRFQKLNKAAAQKPHGTRLRYMAGCKCVPCRAANSRYETARALARRNGEWNGLVDASKARRHIIALSKKGVGRRAVSEASGVAVTVVQLIKNGTRRKIRAINERNILKVDVHAKSASAIVPAAPTWKKVNWLLNQGFTKGSLAKRLGYKNAALQINQNKVLVKTAVRVEKLYRQMHR